MEHVEILYDGENMKDSIKIPSLPISSIEKRTRSNSLLPPNRITRDADYRPSITRRGSISSNEVRIEATRTQSTPPTTQSSPATSPQSSPPSARKAVKKKMNKLKLKFKTGNATKNHIKRSKSDVTVSSQEKAFDKLFSTAVSSHSFLEEKFQLTQSLSENCTYQDKLMAELESESDKYTSDSVSEFESEKPAYLLEPKDKCINYQSLIASIANPTTQKYYTKQEWNSFKYWVTEVIKLQLDPSEQPSLPPSIRMLIFLHFFRLEIPLSLITAKNIKTSSDWKNEKRFPSKIASFIQVPMNSAKSYHWWCTSDTPDLFSDSLGLCLICHQFQTISGTEEQKIDVAKLRREFQTMVLNNDSISSILSSPPNVQSIYIKLLIKWATSTKKSVSVDLHLASCKVLAYLSYPVESIAGLRRKLLRSGAFISILTFAKQGKLIISPAVDLDDIEFDGLLGRGAVGKVYKGSWKNETVAIKVCKKGNVAFIREEFCFEVALMSAIQHPHILSCLAAKLDPNAKFFVLLSPLNEKGCLYDIIRNEKEEISDYKKIWIAYCIADAIKHLHKNHIIHRDIKSSNVLVGENWEQVNLTDFGTSRFFPKYDPTPLEGFVGTNEWMAPEMLENEGVNYSHKVDVYSFAILLFEIITRTTPFNGLKSWQVCDLVKGGSRPVPISSSNPNPYLSCAEINANDPFVHYTPKELVTLMKECWHPSPRKRPNFNTIKSKLTILLKKYRKNSLNSSINSLLLPLNLHDQIEKSSGKCKTDIEGDDVRLRKYLSTYDNRRSSLAKSTTRKCNFSPVIRNKSSSEDDDDVESHLNHLDCMDEEDD